MSRALTSIERAVMAQLETQDAHLTLPLLASKAGTTQKAARTAVQALRWRGLMAWDRLEKSSATPEREPARCNHAAATEPQIERPESEPPQKPSIVAQADRRVLSIGDRVPLPNDWDAERWRQARSAQQARMRPAPKSGVRATLAANEAKRRAIEAERRGSLLEEAKIRLRRRGFAVHNADVGHPGRKGIIVGTRLISEAELMALAGLAAVETPKGKRGRKRGTTRGDSDGPLPDPRDRPQDLAL
jgi:hypothetical protein